MFREALEIAIILSVVLAATKGVPGRALWSWIGIALGLAGSLTIAYFISEISSWAEGLGQEIFSAGILLTAALVIGWTVLWMRAHARHMVGKLKRVGQDIKDGDKHMFAISIVIALAFLREGAEIALFGNGILASGKTTLVEFFLGAFIGLGLGTLFGVLMYFGLLKISTRHIFKITSWLMIFLAAGMALNAAGNLVSAGIIEILTEPVWDISAILPDSSLAGRFFGTLVGYTASPTGIQLAFYCATVAILVTGMILVDKKFSKIIPTRSTA